VATKEGGVNYKSHTYGLVKVFTGWLHPEQTIKVSHWGRGQL